MYISPDIMIDESELHERYIRASGPGGQNVNKVSTAVQLRFDVASSPALAAEVKARLTRLAGSRMTGEGVLVIDARRFRTRERNRADARERLAALLLQASRRPKPRRKTRPTLSSRRRRLEDKRQRGETKRGRRKPGQDTD
ncbi:MAG: alternative ribosome rescue aminoacyl-tRNA hydrolase ArfB [Pseudomonadota bacterium]|nr:alternative ribosome rescue aminoacyl-tRNA hydrolase ArfB [Pseudomonadota bacterium]